MSQKDQNAVSNSSASTSSLQSGLLLRCSKVWEDYIEVQWKREFYDGRKTLHFILNATAPDLKLTKTLEADKDSYRISGLPGKTTVHVTLQLEVADRFAPDGSLQLPPLSITARTLTCAQLEVGSVLPDQLHARVCRYVDPGKIAHQREQLALQREQAKELGLLLATSAEDAGDEGDDANDEIIISNNNDENSVVTKHVPGTRASSMFSNGDNEVPIAKFQMQITQIGRVLSHDIPVQEFVLTPDQQRYLLELSSTNNSNNNAKNNSSSSCGVDFFVKDEVECNARYTTKCRAVSIFGDLGRWSPQTRFLTLLPVRVEVTDIGETEISIQWGRGDNDESYIDDASIDNLTIAVELLPSQKEVDLDPDAPATHVDTKAFSNEVRRYTIKGLESGRTYRIKTRYSNILGDTSAWDLVKATTLFPVEPCEVVVVGTNFIHVRWRRSKPSAHDTISIPPHICCPSTSSANILKNNKNGSAIATTNANLNDQVAEWEIRCAVGTAFTSATLAGKENETRLTNLGAGVEYAIDVRAITPSGRVGLWSPVVTATVLHALQPRMIAAGESWVKVAWDRKETMFRDNIERFHVQINCVSSPFRVAKYFPGDVTRYTFRELKPNTRYQISLQSFSDGRWGPWGTPVSIATCSVPIPRLVRRGEEFVQMEWSSDYYEKAEVDSAKQVFQLRIQRRLANGTTETQETIVDRPSYRTPKLGALATLDVKVRSFDYSTNDWGSWGPAVTFKTLPAAVVVTHIGETVTEVSWSRVPALYRAINDDQILNGIEDPLMPASVSQYQLRVNKLIEEAAVIRDELHCTFYCRADQPTTFVIPDLAPDTDYSVQISYLDENDHWSVFSSPVLFSTTPKLQLEVREIGESRSVLQWGRNSKKRNALMAKLIANSNAQQRAAVAEGHIPSSALAIGDGITTTTTTITAATAASNSSDIAAAAAASKSKSLEQQLADASGSAFRVVVHDIAAEYFKSQKENADDAEIKRRALPLQFTVRGELSLIVTELRPNTAYRAEIASSTHSSAWGTWSEPVHFMTMPPIATHVQNCGETFISVRWARAERSSFLTKLFPNLVLKSLLSRNNDGGNEVNVAENDDEILENEQEFGGTVARGSSTTTTTSSTINKKNKNQQQQQHSSMSFDDEISSAPKETTIVWVQDNDDGEYELTCTKYESYGSNNNNNENNQDNMMLATATSWKKNNNNSNSNSNNNNNNNTNKYGFTSSFASYHQQQQNNPSIHQSIIVATGTAQNPSNTANKLIFASLFGKPSSSDNSFNNNNSSLEENNTNNINNNNNNKTNNQKVSFVDLDPDTNYIIKIRSRLQSSVNDWSAWAESITAKTALATQVRVSNAGVEGVTLSWGYDATAVAEEEERKQKELIMLYGQEYYQQHYGSGGNNNHSSFNNMSTSSVTNALRSAVNTVVKIEYNFELEIKGFDDNLSLTKTIKSATSSLSTNNNNNNNSNNITLGHEGGHTTTSFQLNGLNIGCCYGARARRQDRITGLWGNFCSWHYFSLVVHSVQLVESAQDWIHVQWDPFKNLAQPQQNNNNNNLGTSHSNNTSHNILNISTSTSNNTNNNISGLKQGKASNNSSLVLNNGITAVPHALILTLTGDGHGQAIQMPDPAATEYAFTGLAPNTPYSIRLLAVIDRPKHDPEEYELQKTMAQNRPRRLAPGIGDTASANANGANNNNNNSSGGDPSRDNNNNNSNVKEGNASSEVHGAPFALPLVSTDYFRFAMSGLVARTKKVLSAKFERVGQTFAVLSWVADGDIPSSAFEVQVNEMNPQNATEVKSTRIHTVHGRTYTVIRELPPQSRIRCSVRSVTRSTATTTSWCSAVEIVLLPRLSVSLNHQNFTSSPIPNSHNISSTSAAATTSHNKPPIGENYLSITWLPETVSGPDTIFEVRVEQGGEEILQQQFNNNQQNQKSPSSSFSSPPQTIIIDSSPLKPKKYQGDDDDSIEIFETKEQRFTIQGLSPDTIYTIRVRPKTVLDIKITGKDAVPVYANSAVVADKSAANDANQLQTAAVLAAHKPLPSQLCFGAWSEPFIKSTLSPLSVTVQQIRENIGTVHWCRRARTRFSGRWWETCSVADKREDVSAISAFQLHIYERLHESAVFRLIVDEIIPDNQVDFQNCSRSMTMLRPDAEYEVCIRANTGLQWGKWSDRHRFGTKQCAKPEVSLVRESACRLEWNLSSLQPGKSLMNNNNNNNHPTLALQPSAHYVARITTIRTNEVELVNLKSKSATDKGYCILSGLEPNTSYSLCLRSQYTDGDVGPWGESAYFVTQAPLEVDVANVSESFANILWRRVPQRTMAQDLKAQRSIAITDLNKMIDKQIAKRMKTISAWNIQQQQFDEINALSSSQAGRRRFQNGNNSSPFRDSTAAFNENNPLLFSSLNGTGNNSNNNNNNNSPSSADPYVQAQALHNHAKNLARLDTTIEQATRRRDAELELMELHAEELDDQAVYAEGTIDHIEVVCEDMNLLAAMESDHDDDEDDEDEGKNNNNNDDDDDDQDDSSDHDHNNNNNNNNNNRMKKKDQQLQVKKEKRRLRFLEHENNLKKKQHQNSNLARILTKGETFCRQDELEGNTPYLVKVRTLVKENNNNSINNNSDSSPLFASSNIQQEGLPKPKPSQNLLFDSENDIVVVSASSLGNQAKVGLHPLKGIYGIWHTVSFTTLKPISLFLRAVGSEAGVFQWDTGAKENQNQNNNVDDSSRISQQQRSKRTAITAFNVKVYPLGSIGFEEGEDVINATLQEPSATSHIVRGLEPNTDYTAVVRVCYEGIQWGGWSEAVNFSTLDLLQGKVETLEENLARILVWRETGPNTPPITTHRLIVNGAMCPDPFEIERGASTVLTMDSITLDTEFIVEIADFVCPGEWQKPKEIIRFESLPKPPLDLTLVARREQVYTIVWSYEPKLATDYVFWLQRAVVGPRALSRGIEPEWQTLATMTDKQLELELPQGVNIDWYLFRFCVAKFRHTVSGAPLPESNLVCVNPHNIFPALDTSRLHWSNWSPPLRIPQPRPPEEPRNLQLRRVFATRAELHWAHSQRVRDAQGNILNNGPVVYHVFTSPVIEGSSAAYSLAGSTASNSIDVMHLLPTTRYRCYIVAENNFGRTTGTKRVNFTTRFDEAGGGGVGGASGGNNNYYHQQQMTMMRNQHFDSAQMNNNNNGHENKSGAELLRSVRGLPQGR